MREQLFKKGSKLHSADREHVLRAYVHRFTKDHKPAWTNKPWKDSKPYPVQFSSDADWLENTLFAVRNDGRLDARVKTCQSHCTWPDNPELRKA